MPNPIPTRYRKPLGSSLICMLVYLAMTALHAMYEGRVEPPPAFLVVGFLIGSALAILLRGARSDEPA